MSAAIGALVAPCESASSETGRSDAGDPDWAAGPSFAMVRAIDGRPVVMDEVDGAPCAALALAVAAVSDGCGPDVKRRVGAAPF